MHDERDVAKIRSDQYVDHLFPAPAVKVSGQKAALKIYPRTEDLG